MKQPRGMEGEGGIEKIICGKGYFQGGIPCLLTWWSQLLLIDSDTPSLDTPFQLTIETSPVKNAMYCPCQKHCCLHVTIRDGLGIQLDRAF